MAVVSTREYHVAPRWGVWASGWSPWTRGALDAWEDGDAPGRLVAYWSPMRLKAAALPGGPKPVWKGRAAGDEGGAAAIGRGLAENYCECAWVEGPRADQRSAALAALWPGLVVRPVIRPMTPRGPVAGANEFGLILSVGLRVGAQRWGNGGFESSFGASRVVPRDGDSWLTFRARVVSEGRHLLARTLVELGLAVSSRKGVPFGMMPPTEAGAPANCGGHVE